MKIKLLTSMAGPNHSYGYGDEVDVPDVDAKRLIERGMAQPVREAKVERTTSSAAETAETASARTRRATKSRKG